MTYTARNGVLILRTWYIVKCGWDAYFQEVHAMTRGRIDLIIVCQEPGVISVGRKA